MLELFKKGDAIDYITLSENLKIKSKLEKIGGVSYLTELTNFVSTSANIESYAHIILEKSILRGIISNSTEAIEKAYKDNEDALNLLDETERNIFQLSEKRMKKTVVQMESAVSAVMHKLDKIHRSHDIVTGVPTGFLDLDNLTGGFKNSDLIIIAGRPSQGKTSLAMTISKNSALHKKHPTSIAVFSIEMSLEQLVIRLLSAEAEIDQRSLFNKSNIKSEQWKKLSEAAKILSDTKIFIDDTGSLSILELRAKARRLKSEHNIGMLIVDYLQLIRTDENLPREQQVSFISRSLKAIAKELDIPVVALSQLNRASIGRKEMRPQLADLRESGAIEQDADVVILVHRPETYRIETMNDGKGNEISSEGLAEITIAKQRNGPTGEIVLKFEKQFAKFSNYDAYHNAQTIPTIQRNVDVPF